MNWFIDALKNKYAEFSGRAHRTEYWMYILFYLILVIVVSILEGILGLTGVISGLVSLALLVPTIAVTVRRLHDTGRSGWWFLLALVPVVNLVLLVFMLLESEPGSNEYGPNPYGN